VTRFFHDYETFSFADLKAVGLSRYLRDKTTKPLMLAWAFDDGPVEQWVEGQRLPKDVRDALRDPSVIKSAWNAQFEWGVTNLVLGIDSPIEQYRCSMVHAMTLSFPGSLDKVGEIVRLPQDTRKLSRGKTLVRKFCGPQKPTKARPDILRTAESDPDDWQEFLLYNRQDVEAERAIWCRIRKYDLPEHEWDLWHLDQKINWAGIPINRRAVEGADRICKTYTAAALAEMKRITGLDNPNSGTQLLPWLQERGYRFEDLKKGHVKTGRDEAADKAVKRVLTLRSETSKSSVKKFPAILNALDDDDMLRCCFQFAGAQRTWRWAGRRLQPQNLARPAWYLEKLQTTLADAAEDLDWQDIEVLFGPPITAMSSAIRPMVQALPGYTLLDVDLNAIENRVLGWMADDQKILDVFVAGRDPYLDFATFMFDQTYEEILKEYKSGDKKKRTTSKPPVLGCGYGLSAGFSYEDEATGELVATGLLGYAWNMGVKLTEEESSKAVAVWRETYSATVDYWYEIERAMARTIRTGEAYRAKHVSFDVAGPFVRMRLPSGRYLHYCRPKLENKMMPWGKYKEVITYEEINEKNQWVRAQTRGSKLVENADQAIARDLLAHGMMLAHREGLDIRIHVHDQVVPMVPESTAERDLAILKHCLTTQPPWAPDMPLGAGGHIGKYFQKD
jgi:DNA polymerase